MSNLTAKEASAQISNLIAEAQTLVYEAEALADEHNVSFRMNLGDYGMGGYYDGEEGGWNASSQSC